VVGSPHGHDDELTALLAQITDDDAPIASAPALGSALTKPTDVSRPSRPAAPAVEPAGGIAFVPDFASFGARAIGLIVDLVVLAVFLAPGALLIALGSTPMVVLGLGALLVGFVAATVVYARHVSRSGQSLGNRVAGTSVVDARNGRMIDSGEAATRYALRFLVSSILFGGFLIAFGNAERRTFHDKFAGTVVIRPARASWSIDDEVTAPPTT
jgi:uncharacterized RDD family membrane protein YckC